MSTEPRLPRHHDEEAQTKTYVNDISTTVQYGDLLAEIEGALNEGGEN